MNVVAVCNSAVISDSRLRWAMFITVQFGNSKQETLVRVKCRAVEHGG